jgi:chemotaxis family two-component system sensor kinase Cph1
VRNRATAWLDCEIAAAVALLQVITEVALTRMNEDLMRSNSELDSFAYIAAHDLKEPLRGISNFATFLKDSADTRLTTEEHGRIQTIIRLTRRMDDLTDALLQYSRVGRTEFLLETVDLNELLRQTLEPLQAHLVAAGIDLRVPRSLPTVRTDHIWLAEVFSNLISNAIKYSDQPAGKRWVEVGWQMKDEQRLFYVQDNGIGIAPQHLEDVFRIFRRLHARDAYAGGNGAGLTIARRTVERLGGRLWVESDGLGKGSTFLFTLDRPVKGLVPC